jgi:hypothetical protein
VSTLTYGYLFVALSPELLTDPDAHQACREYAHAEASRTGGELLIGPPLLIHFHPLTRMFTHLVFPMAREVREQWDS